MRLTNSNKKMRKTHCAFKPGKKETIIILWIQVTGFFSFLVCCAEWLSVTAMCDIATNLRLKRGDLFYPNAKKLQKTISYFFVEKIFRTKNVTLFPLVMEAKLGEIFHLGIWWHAYVTEQGIKSVSQIRRMNNLQSINCVRGSGVV